MGYEHQLSATLTPRASTVAPMNNPATGQVTVCITWLPVGTADTSAGWPNWPTAIRSTAPYIACKTAPAVLEQ